MYNRKFSKDPLYDIIVGIPAILITVGLIVWTVYNAVTDTENLIGCLMVLFIVLLPLLAVETFITVKSYIQFKNEP